MINVPSKRNGLKSSPPDPEQIQSRELAHSILAKWIWRGARDRREWTHGFDRLL
jgi:hypothetical protein